MEKIYSNNDLKIIKYDCEDYLSNPNEIIKNYGQIFESYENNSVNFDRESSNKNLMATLNDFLTEETASLYILYKKNIPVSAVTFTTENDHSHLELIVTRKDYRLWGFAKLISLEAFKDLKKQGVRDISLVVNQKNHKSNYLQESLSQVEGIEAFITEDTDLLGYTFDISCFEDYDQLIC